MDKRVWTKPRIAGSLLGVFVAGLLFMSPLASAQVISPMAWNPADQKLGGIGGDDVYGEYALPFTFPFFGRSIVKISVNTNGLIELLEAGESCEHCGSTCAHNGGSYPNEVDAIFAAEGDLLPGVLIEEFADRVEIIWIGTTYSDEDPQTYPLEFRVILFDDGRIQWKFFDMDYDSYVCDLFSGVYDEGGDTEYEVPGGSLSFQGPDVNTAFEFDPLVPGISSIDWNPADQKLGLTALTIGDDSYADYTLPFTFPFFGRSIVEASVNTNGLIELLEADEECYECEGYETHEDGDHIGTMDAIFAANDDLITAVFLEEFADRVELIWIGSTYDDNDPVGHRIEFRAILFDDGRVQWKFFDMNYEDYSGDLFSGVYALEEGTEREVPCGTLALSGEDVNTAFEFDPAPAAPGCGNQIIEWKRGETCDPPDCHLRGGWHCNETCQVVYISVCGDGWIDWRQGETCDPPGSVCGARGNSDWMCSDTCHCEYVGHCGDGKVQWGAGEECEIPPLDRCGPGRQCVNCVCVPN